MSFTKKDTLVLGEKLLNELYRESKGDESFNISIDYLYKMVCAADYLHVNYTDSNDLKKSVVELLEGQGFIKMDGEKTWITDRGKRHVKGM
ncbi:MAG: hypothetical protein M3162_07560 [Thermoproteota archaeon]|nr:hypothetical protein [Thermoproteota archaeon]